MMELKMIMDLQNDLFFYNVSQTSYFLPTQRTDIKVINYDFYIDYFYIHICVANFT